MSTRPEHAVLSASGKHRWGKCAASLPLAAIYPDTDTAYSRQGTVAHLLGALALRERNPCLTYVGRTFDKYPEIPVDEEMAINVQIYVDRVMRDVNEFDGDLLAIEQEVDTSPVMGFPDQYGTADAIVLRLSTKMLIVTDLKYGMGEVKASDNDQLLTYGTAAYLSLRSQGADIDGITLRIIQPRLNSIDEVIVSPESLQEFIHRSQAEAARAMHAKRLYEQTGVVPLELYQPGASQCHWCPHKANCEALHAHAMSVAKATFSNLDESIKAVKNPADVELFEQALPHVELIMMWCKAVEERARQRLEAGHPVPGRKLILGKRGSREWVDEDGAIKRMKQGKLKQDEYMPRVLLSPPQAEKLMKEKGLPAVWRRLEDVITQTDGKPTMVSADHESPEYIPPVKRLSNLDASTQGVTQPEATQSEATQPEATQPEATQPEATQPEGPNVGLPGMHLI